MVEAPQQADAGCRPGCSNPASDSRRASPTHSHPTPTARTRIRLAFLSRRAGPVRPNPWQGGATIFRNAIPPYE
jgi:hypothetical protein